MIKSTRHSYLDSALKLEPTLNFINLDYVQPFFFFDFKIKTNITLVFENKKPCLTFTSFFFPFHVQQGMNLINQRYDSESEYRTLLILSSPDGNKLFPYGWNLIQWGSECWSSFIDLKTGIHSEPEIIKDSALYFGSSLCGGDLNTGRGLFLELVRIIIKMIKIKIFRVQQLTTMEWRVNQFMQKLILAFQMLKYDKRFEATWIWMTYKAKAVTANVDQLCAT